MDLLINTATRGTRGQIIKYKSHATSTISTEGFYSLFNEESSMRQTIGSLSKDVSRENFNVTSTFHVKIPIEKP